MAELSHNPRLRYLFNRRSGRTFVVPMDHGISMGPVPGLYDMHQTVEQMAGTGVNGIVVHKGLVRSVAPVLRRSADVGLIVHLCGSTTQAPERVSSETPSYLAPASRSAPVSNLSKSAREK